MTVYAEANIFLAKDSNFTVLLKEGRAGEAS
jgi:hypothetical protein